MVNGNPWFWMLALAGVALFCIAQAIRDFRAKRYVWAVGAILSAAIIVTLPVKTHAIKLDLPAPAQP